MKKTKTIVLAAIFCTVALISGFVALGIWGMILFSFGFIGGFIFWISRTETIAWKSIKVPYIITLLLFIAHKIEEKQMGFFAAFSELTGVPVPSSSSTVAIVLNITALSWLGIPFLIRKRKSFGYFLAWTFFTAMGITELAHFSFPILKNEPYSYFPGMGSAIFLVPSAWIGLYQLFNKQQEEDISID